ncbi:MAG: serpin family protein [Clostridiaceae bacterium]|nr:serpin family protein [Clostridiaceae bacterium]
MSQASKSKLKKEVKKITLKRLGFTAIPLVAALLAFIIVFTGVLGNGGTLKVLAQDLMKGIVPQKVASIELKDNFIRSTSDFSVDLFKQAYTKGENSLVSPTSVYLALGMTANGADGNTLKEFETLLGKYSINIRDLNAYYNSLSKKLTKVDSGKLSIANSIWYRQDFDVKKDFLQTNADYYNASAYKADFNEQKTVEDINKWVKFNTGNLIDKIIDKTDANTVMYLINAVYFQDQWKKIYEKDDIRKDTFQLENGTKQSVDFMYSEEDWYLKDDKAEGFIKPYKNGKYSFVALIPNKDVNIDNYISSLTGESFVKLLKNKLEETVTTGLPKFKEEYSIKLVDPLKKMGLNDCFYPDKANFTKMVSSNPGDIFVGEILHKTFITVDAEGTKAAAVTEVEMRTKGSSIISHSIILNRPFVYAIIDNETNLPLFMGTMMKPQ